MQEEFSVISWCRNVSEIGRLISSHERVKGTGLVIAELKTRESGSPE
jgi:hypothetical protein